MLKKIVIGLLLVTVVGSTALAVLDRQTVSRVTVPATIVAAVPTVAAPTAAAPTVAAPAVTSAQTEEAPAVTAQPQPAAASSVGAVWSGSGRIVDLSSTGMTLALDGGSDVFVELGPQDYWQSQNVTLNTGASVRVDGFFNGTDYHARAVTTSNGLVLALRDEAGQPLWSGGSTNGASSGQGQDQVSADQWITIDGTVTALTNNGIVVATTDASTLTVSFGRADFWQTQATTFSAGDAVSLLGFWQGDQFNAGQVTNTTTGERILLRDPNGRPLWAGPGRNQGSSNGSGGNGNGNGGNGNGGNGNGGNGNGNGGNGNDNGGNGNGQGTSTPETTTN